MSEEIEQELRAVLSEMHGDAAWTRLDSDAQVKWLRWISNSGEAPRVRMCQAANYLAEGRVTPPRWSKLRAIGAAVADQLLDWP